MQAQRNPFPVLAVMSPVVPLAHLDSRPDRQHAAVFRQLQPQTPQMTVSNIYSEDANDLGLRKIHKY